MAVDVFRVPMQSERPLEFLSLRPPCPTPGLPRLPRCLARPSAARLSASRPPISDGRTNDGERSLARSRVSGGASAGHGAGKQALSQEALSTSQVRDRKGEKQGIDRGHRFAYCSISSN